MTTYRRYGIYVVPQGEFYSAGAEWLGWDSTSGIAVPHPAVDDIKRPVADLTRTPRKYGFHGTIKPPFRLVGDQSETDLRNATAALCKQLAPVTVPMLDVRRIGGFVAVVPSERSEGLSRLAADVVTELDRFRAPLTEAELARRRKSGLSDRQEALLSSWGYPYVLDEFRFHLTLTGHLGSDADAVARMLSTHFAPVLPKPFRINSLCLMGEDQDGMFHLVQRYTLSG